MDELSERPAQSTSVIWLRWLAVLPAALGAAAIARVTIRMLNAWTVPRYTGLDPDSFLFNLYITFTGDVVMGAVLVYVAGRVAPFMKSSVVLVAAAFVLIANGYSVYLAIAMNLDYVYEALFSAVCICAGAVGMAVTIFKGGIDSAGAA